MIHLSNFLSRLCKEPGGGRRLFSLMTYNFTIKKKKTKLLFCKLDIFPRMNPALILF